MSQVLLDPKRLAALHALGVSTVYVRRDVLRKAQPPTRHVPSGTAANPSGDLGTSAATEQLARRTGAGIADVAQARAASAAPQATVGAVAEQSGSTQVPSSRLQQISIMGLDELAAFTQSCRACKLGGIRHQAVFGTGNPAAQVMIVGEAPGADEDRLGQPFVGPAGRLLDNMLRTMGLGRSGEDPARTVFIANVIKCRPPGNRNPEVDEIAQCEPILKRQIALVRPRLLLALGRFAAQTLTGSSEPIGRLRQRVFRYEGIPVVVTYHPAYLLRTPLDKAKAWADLCFAQDQLAVTLEAQTRHGS